MDYKEEQTQELDALGSIYPAELTVVSAEFPAVFQVRVCSEGFVEDDDESVGLSVVVQFSYVPTYPDEIPSIEFAETTNVEPLDEERLLEELSAEARESIGMPHIFTLVSGLQEKLNGLVEVMKQRLLEAEERRKAEEEERERKRLEGTPVNVETFLAWKKRFDAERLANSVTVVVDHGGRLTGRQQFLRDATLLLSDIKLIEQEGDVPIDESLFQDLDDLGLEASEGEEEEEK